MKKINYNENTEDLEVPLDLLFYLMAFCARRKKKNII